MKCLIICFICLMIGACGKLPPSEQRHDAQWSLGDYDYYCAGMHYKVLSRYAGGVTVINITLDSLKFQSYMIDSSKFVTRFKVNAKGRVTDKEYIEPMDSANYYYTKLLRLDPIDNVDSFFKYQNLYANASNNNK